MQATLEIGRQQHLAMIQSIPEIENECLKNVLNAFLRKIISYVYSHHCKNLALNLYLKPFSIHENSIRLNAIRNPRLNQIASYYYVLVVLCTRAENLGFAVPISYSENCTRKANLQASVAALLFIIAMKECCD